MNALGYAEAIQSALGRPDIVRVAVEVADRCNPRFTYRFNGERILIVPIRGTHYRLTITEQNIAVWTQSRTVTQIDDPLQISVFLSRFHAALIMLLNILDTLWVEVWDKTVESGVGNIALVIDVTLGGGEKRTIRKDLNSRFLRRVYR